MCSDIILVIVLWYLLKRYSYKKGYEQGDYDGYRRYHYNQICIDCKGLKNCRNPKGYNDCNNNPGYCKWES